MPVSVIVNSEEEIRYFLYCSLSHLNKKGPVTEADTCFGEPDWASEIAGCTCLCLLVLGFQAHGTLLVLYGVLTQVFMLAQAGAFTLVALSAASLFLVAYMLCIRQWLHQHTSIQIYHIG